MHFLPMFILIYIFLLLPAFVISMFGSVLEESCNSRECILYKLLNSKIQPGELHKRSGADLIRQNGYPLEYHNITSRDGYITTLFRIPHGNSHSHNVTRVPILLHHGFIADGFQWILNSVEKALAYRLADKGLDVWITNNRGCIYSLDHEKLSWRNLKYWDFSFHEIATYDVPLIIDYILKETGRPKLYYVAHSMGCATFFAFISMFPEYNSKVITFIGLAPAVIVGNTSSPLENIRPILLNHQYLHDAYLQGPLISPDFLPLMQLMGHVCSPKILSRWICFAALEIIFGYNFIEENSYDLRTDIVTIGLSSTSIKVFIHLMQLWKTGKFQQYDYLKKNVAVYGQVHPPQYDLQKITTPVALYCGSDDHLVSCLDVVHLSFQLPNLKELHRIEEPHFNHLDFLFSTDVNRLLNDRLMQIIATNEFGDPE